MKCLTQVKKRTHLHCKLQHSYTLDEVKDKKQGILYAKKIIFGTFFHDFPDCMNPVKQL